MNVWWRSVSEYVYGLLYSVDLSSALTCTYITQTHTGRHELALTPKTEIETAENVRSRKKAAEYCQWVARTLTFCIFLSFNIFVSMFKMFLSDFFQPTNQPAIHLSLISFNIVITCTRDGLDSRTDRHNWIERSEF